jgi:hypothetical protein
MPEIKMMKPEKIIKKKLKKNDKKQKQNEKNIKIVFN